MNADNKVRFFPAGDRALAVVFGSEIREEINERVHLLASQIKQENDWAIVETVPAFCSLLVHYKPEVKSYEELCQYLRGILHRTFKLKGQKKRILKVPVCYGARFGPDLGEMERLLKIDRDEIIAIHSSMDYKIYMLGFLPGFTYLGGLDSRICCPRLPSPRVKIPAGAVGIGGSQTGIYPVASPGGWRLIGQTPIELYDPKRTDPVPVRAGDYIRFEPVGLFEWYEIKREVSLGTYRMEWIEEESDEKTSDEKLSDEKLSNEKSSNEKSSNKKSSEGLSFLITAAGALTTVQDEGRFGSQELGVTQSGAMDWKAYRLANKLVGNSGGEAALEMTVSGISCKIQGRGVIAVTGADITPELNGEPLPMNQAAAVKEGDVFSSGFAVNGCRSYLAASGGIDVPVVMGSRSTHLKCQFGGLEGRRLKSGDLITCFAPSETVKHKIEQIFSVQREKKQGGKEALQERLIGEQAVCPPYENSILLRFIPGPQADMFTEDAMEAFCRAKYRVDEKSDRMGYRLEGPPVLAISGTDIISDGIVLGSIQIPPNGKPIVLMADHQTTGGYAKIGTVINEDICKLAQLLPGGQVQFKKLEFSMENGIE